MEEVKKKKFQCALCNKTFSKKQWLNYHLNDTKVPCDLKCKICGKVLSSRKYYLNHQTRVHNEQKTDDQPAKQNSIVPMKLEQHAIETMFESEQDNDIQYPIPLEDFDDKILEMIHHMPTEELLKLPGVEVEMTTEQVVGIRTFVNKKGDVERESVRLTREREAIKIKRVWEARQALTNAMLCRTMRSMQYGDPNSDIHTIATENLHAILRSDDTKLHSMCLSDSSRGTVKTYSRQNDGACKWVTHPKADALKVVANHAKLLFRFLLESGTNALRCATFEEQPCLALDSNNEYALIFMSPDNSLRVLWQRTFLVTFEDQATPDLRLIDMIRARKEEVIEQLKHLIIANESLEECLRDSRLQCVETLKKTM